MLDQVGLKRRLERREKLARHGQSMLSMGFSLSDVIAEMERRSEDEREWTSALKRLEQITGALF